MNSPFIGRKTLLVETDSSTSLQPMLVLTNNTSPTSSTDRGSDGNSIVRKRLPESADAPKRSRKKDEVDSRWSQRFTWPDELHRDFVAAIFDVGLKHASPSSIFENMPKSDIVTTERIKSHLQKYRLHRMKSKKEFMDNYEASLKQFKNGELGLIDSKSLKSAEVAAHLSYSSITVSEADSDDVDRESLLQGGVIQLPILTDDEKKSPIGSSMGYMLGLFFSLKQQLYLSRSTEGISTGPPLSLTTKDYAQAETVTSNPTALKESFFSSVTNHDMNGAFHSSLFTMNPLEETNNMKREMQHHINFQNNLRRMKEQEFTKCMTLTGDPILQNKMSGLNQHKDESVQNNVLLQVGKNHGDDSMFLQKVESRGESVLAPDDLWNTDGVDEAFLFEFLRDE